MATATQELHRLTALSRYGRYTHRARLAQGYRTDDLTHFPWFYKHYADSLPVTELTRALPATVDSTVAVLAGTAGVAPTELDLPSLSRLLHLAAGVVRTAARSYGTHLFRAAGSAGGRFPLELYVVVPEGHAVEAGVHWYEPLRHALVRIGPPPEGSAPAVVVTGVPWRTGWRYRERGFRHLYWDAGSMLAQLLAAADSTGLRPALYSRFPDADVAALVGADRVHELPLAVVGLGAGTPALTSTGPPATAAVDAEPREFPLVTAAHRASSWDRLGPAWAAGAPVEATADGSATVDVVALARGSQRRMDPTHGVSVDLLRTSMRAALRGVDIPHWVAVHSVYGLVPGLYRWPDLGAPVRAGALRRELYQVCLRQGLGRDAAFVAIAATDVGALDDRGYCEAQLGAGLVSGRLHLLAYALGASATGMTFADAALAALLGERLDGLLFTCVGVPGYRSSAGGPPGAPTEIRMVRPR
jgi:SagB-type dehydrogenase family enzyme